MNRLARFAAILLSTIALASCGLPRGAALQSEIVGSSDSAAVDFAVYPVTRALLPSVAEWPQVNQPHLGWITASQGSRGRMVTAGDTVSIQIWDSNESSLLVPPGARQIMLPDMRVSPSGTIFVPYVGDINVAGVPPEAARTRVEERLTSVAPSAQVQLSLQEGRSNSVDLVGGVTAPGTYPMPDRNYSVLSLIAAGGGVSETLSNPQIRLQREGRIFGTSINRLYDEPDLDTRLIGGDQVIVQEDDRYFLSIGAAGDEALHPFTQDVVSAMDAASIIGGIDDGRGNPEGVLILREYPSSALSAGERGPRMERVVFTLDLTTADGLFSARSFQIMPKDVVYVTESYVTSAQTILALVGTGFGLAKLANTIDN